MLHKWLRNRILEKAGVATQNPGHLKGVSREELRNTQWSETFEYAMRVRLMMGAFRYGPFGVGTKRVERHRNIESAIRRLQRYLREGNREDLVDAANLCLVEWVLPGSHPNPHFTPRDGQPQHTQKVVED